MAVADARVMTLGLLALSLTLGLVAGCTTMQDVARARAVTDLRCPSERISVYDAAHNATVARGCGAWTQYQCFVTRTRLVCVRDAPVTLNASPPAGPVE